ncbi:hypothetical protein [Methylobacterium sp. sgz302541]|uniref:hypothetical protein n=1 Tax=unclassified Methylobacterium TaxID=2615210 RepID=UPI003D3282E6
MKVRLHGYGTGSAEGESARQYATLRGTIDVKACKFSLSPEQRFALSLVGQTSKRSQASGDNAFSLDFLDGTVADVTQVAGMFLHYAARRRATEFFLQRNDVEWATQHGTQPSPPERFHSSTEAEVAKVIRWVRHMADKLEAANRGENIDPNKKRSVEQVSAEP